MKKKLRAALYDPYLDVLGGGERHILSILTTLQEEGYQINIFWDSNLTNKIRERFQLDFSKASWQSNIFKKRFFPLSILKTIQILRTFELFFYVTNGSYFFSSAKKNFVFCMVPNKKLYPMNFFNKIKTWNYHFITNSQFTQKRLQERGIKSEVIYPYVEDKLINTKLNLKKKDKIILSVGRFFQHLHSKNQEQLVISYKKIKQKYPVFKKFKLILAGGLKKEDEDYFNKLKDLTKNDPLIIFKPNITFSQLYQLYQLSTFFWHFTGYGQDEEKQPETVEHLGIAPLEAMASGCITFCYNAGGPKEIIQDGKNGFLFSNENDLFKKNLMILKNPHLQQKIVTNGQNYVKKFFSYSVFKERVKKIIL